MADFRTDIQRDPAGSTAAGGTVSASTRAFLTIVALCGAVAVVANADSLQDFEVPALGGTQANQLGGTPFAGFAPSPWTGRTSSPAGEQPAAAPARTQDRVLVRVAPGTAARLAAAHGVELLRAPGPSGIAVLSVPEGLSAQEFARVLQEDDLVQHNRLLGLVGGTTWD